MATQTWNVNADLIKGSNMNLYLVMPTTAGTIDYSTEKVMAYATSCEFSMNAETIDVSSKLSCRWNSVVQGNASYTVSAEALYCLQANAAANSAYTVDDLFEALKEGFNIGWIMAQDSSDTCGQIAGPDFTKPYYYGTAAITDLSISAGNNEVCTSSITLSGDGEPKNSGLS